MAGMRWGVPPTLRDPDRPLLFSLLFCVGVAGPLVVRALLEVPDWMFGPLWLVPLLVLAAVLWFALPWRGDIGRRWVSAAFLATAVLIAYVDGTGSSMTLMLLGFANLAMVFRPGAGVVAAALLTGILMVSTVHVFHRSVEAALIEGMSIATLSALVLALASAIRRSRQAHEKADRLLTELADAHRELRRQTDRVHELAVAEERTRMARDLHDSVGHHLTVIKVGLENAERYRHRDEEAAWAEVRQAKTLTVDALAEIRRWVRAMRPPSLDGRRGSEALRALAHSFEGTGLTVDVAVEGPERPVDEGREIVLFRVLQESLTNALRHSGAQNVSAKLGFEADAVSMAVVDDGRGGLGAPAGFGLTSLESRVTSVGGRFEAGDDECGGFAVRIRLPEDTR